jgi:hypothetical protein
MERKSKREEDSMQKFITKASVLALVGAMAVTSMVGCGQQTQEEDSSADYVQEDTTELATAVSEVATTDTELETEPVTETEETTEETTVAETTEEEVTETTEDPAIVEWKNSDIYKLGISDLSDNYDNIYATHILMGDAIKLYENGTFDGITDGYDTIWKIYNEDLDYYFKDFSQNTSYIIGSGEYAHSLEDTPDDIGDAYNQMFYIALENKIFVNVTKYDIYDPFENGEAEYKDNTVCILWQKEEGTLEGSQAFYYSIPSENYDNAIELITKKIEDGAMKQRDDDSEKSIAYMFDFSGSAE